MKVVSLFTVAASVAIPYATAQQRAINPNLQEETRRLFHVDGHYEGHDYDGHTHTEEHDHAVPAEGHDVIVFEECVGKYLEECQATIAAAVVANPTLFYSYDALDYEVLPVRTSISYDYYKVGLRTNVAETNVAGVLNNGLVFYPWDWCSDANGGCVSIGPWDCDYGGALSVEDCCQIIKSDVTYPDNNGNELECFVDPPVGSETKPVVTKRVFIHVDSNNVVIHPPRNE